MIKCLYILITLVLIPLTAEAGFILAPGAAFSSGFESEENASNDKSVLTLDSDVGFIIDGEIALLGGFLSLNSSFFAIEQEGLSQYTSTNNALVSDVKVRATTLMGMVGGRVRPINFKRFALYVGGGAVAGSTNLAYDKKDFLSKGGVEANFREDEKASSWGVYAEAGTEFFIDKKSAIRASLRLIDNKTDDYQTLGSRKMEMDFAAFTISYMLNFDWKFRKR